MLCDGIVSSCVWQFFGRQLRRCSWIRILPKRLGKKVYAFRWHSCLARGERISIHLCVPVGLQLREAGEEIAVWLPPISFVSLEKYSGVCVLADRCQPESWKVWLSRCICEVINRCGNRIVGNAWFELTCAIVRLDICLLVIVNPEVSQALCYMVWGIRGLGQGCNIPRWLERAMRIHSNQPWGFVRYR